jgi:hypothetical protein
MLKEADIQEDWAEIKKAQYFAKRNSECKVSGKWYYSYLYMTNS